VSDSHRPSVAEVNLNHIKNNFRIWRKAVGDGVFICPMVKANAYGHGDVQVAKALIQAGANCVGVGIVEEGVRLRTKGFQHPVFLYGVFDANGARAVVDENLTPVLSDWTGLESLHAVLRGRPQKQAFAIHIKFNTGMNRLGFGLDQAEKIKTWLEAHPELRLTGLATHLAIGEDAGVPQGMSEDQLIQFEKVAKIFEVYKPILHALNSSAGVNLHARITQKQSMAKGLTWPLGLRPGISIYGSQPTSNDVAQLRFSPAMSLHSRLAMVRQLVAGESVSYGARWRAQEASWIGVVPFGYADGYRRGLSGKSSVLCRGIRATVTGTVCMDYFMIDLTDIVRRTGSVAPGEPVVLIGEQNGAEVTAEELARELGTISYEILTGISDRVPRRYQESAE